MSVITEAKAKTKWCPFSRKAVTLDTPAGRSLAVASANRDKNDNIITACMASACMAWRWESDAGLSGPHRVHPNVLTDHWKGWTVTDDRPDEKGYVEISPPSSSRETGFCGLAGRPS